VRRIPSAARLPLAALALLAAVAALAPWLAPYPPDAQLDILALRTRPPGWTHPFGTDAFGRDVLSRVLFGARVSLAVSVVAVAVGLAAGTLVGVGAAAAGGGVERLVRRGLEVALAIPRVLVLAVIAGFWGPLPAGALVLVIGLTGWMDIARLVADETTALLGRDYVAAARAAGSGTTRILRRHLLPHLGALLAAMAPVSLAATLALEAGLGFLGLGIQPPQASWGTILQDGITAGPGAWWLTVFPGAAMLLVILTAHLAGERLGAPEAARLREGLPAPQVAGLQVAAGRNASAHPDSALPFVSPSSRQGS
jgi:peptide/nickel transport system permease protein